MDSQENLTLKYRADNIRNNDELASKAGEKIAKALFLKKDREHKDRYKTDWGTKTAAGLARMILRLIEESDAE